MVHLGCTIANAASGADQREWSERLGRNALWLVAACACMGAAAAAVAAWQATEANAREPARPVPNGPPTCARRHAGLWALLLRQRWLLRLAGFRAAAGQAEGEGLEEVVFVAAGRHTAVDRREAVSAGAAAGIASAFGELAGLAWVCLTWQRMAV